MALAGAGEALSSPVESTAVDGVVGFDSPFKRRQVGHQLERAPWLSQGHGGPIELTEAVVPTAGNGEHSACAAVDDDCSTFTDPETACPTDQAAQLPLHNGLQHRIEMGFDQEIPLGGHLRTHERGEIPAHLVGVEGSRSAHGLTTAGAGGQLDGLTACQSGLVEGETTCVGHFVDHRVAGLECPLRMATGVVTIRRWQQTDKQRRLFDGQICG